MLLELGITDKIKQLRREGMRPSDQLVRTITKAGTVAIEPLLELATNTDLLHEEAPECFAPIHALRLLGELDAVNSIEPLLATFPVQLDYEDEELPQSWADEIPQIIGHFGAAAVEPLWSIADDESWNMAGRVGALTALTYTTAADPELRDSVIAGLRERLDASEDKTFSSNLAMALANLGVGDLYPQVLGMYRAGKLDQAILPFAAARQLLLSDSTKRLACAKHPLWERYDQHGPFPAKN